MTYATRRQLLSTLAGAAPAFARQRDRRPNVVVLFADDMDYSDIGCYGRETATPNIDCIGAGAIRFAQFYNTCRCSPSRASILTKLCQHQASAGRTRVRLTVGRAGPRDYSESLTGTPEYFWID